MVSDVCGNQLAHHDRICFLVSGLIFLLTTSIFIPFCLAMNPGRLKTVGLHHPGSFGYQMNLGQWEAPARERTARRKKSQDTSFSSVFFMAVVLERAGFLYILPQFLLRNFSFKVPDHAWF